MCLVDTTKGTKYIMFSSFLFEDILSGKLTDLYIHPPFPRDAKVVEVKEHPSLPDVFIFYIESKLFPFGECSEFKKNLYKNKSEFLNETREKITLT